MKSRAAGIFGDEGIAARTGSTVPGLGQQFEDAVERASANRLRLFRATQMPLLSSDPGADPARRLRRWVRTACGTLAAGLLIYGGLAYLLLPAWWSHYEHHPGLETAPKTAFTREGIPADPLNVGLVGTETEVVRALLASGWQPADPATFRTGLRIAASVLLGRAYPTAPVSNLYLWGRKQDLAFEQLVGTNARQRHHVRFWRARKLDVAGRHLWLGAATFDLSVGLSRLTGKVTHHIAPDVDAERDKLFGDLTRAGQLAQLFEVTGVGPSFSARNGGGDRYYTDGELLVGVLTLNNVAQPAPPEKLPNPVIIDLKDKTWSWLKTLLQ